MINRIFPAEFQVMAISVFQLLGSLSGAIGTFFLGLIGDFVQVDEKPERLGYTLGTTVLFSYIACFPFFILAGL